MVILGLEATFKKRQILVDPEMTVCTKFHLLKIKSV